MIPADCEALNGRIHHGIFLPKFLHEYTDRWLVGQGGQHVGQFTNAFFQGLGDHGLE